MQSCRRFDCCQMDDRSLRPIDPGRYTFEASRSLTKRVYIRAHASVRFMANDLDPLDVTKSLRLPPDHQHRDGEPRLVWTRTKKINDNGVYHGGQWSMSSKAHVDSPRLEMHLAWLLGHLEPHAETIAKFQAAGTRVDFFCYTLGSSTDPPSLPRSIRDRAARLGIDIEIDHYVENEADNAM